MKLQKRPGLLLIWATVLLTMSGVALAFPEKQTVQVEKVRPGVGPHTPYSTGQWYSAALCLAGQGEPLVLLHGFGETWYEWHDLFPLFASRYTVIAPDLRGAGDSERPLMGNDKKTLAADIHDLVRQLGFTKISLVGNDIGLMITYAYAAAHPDEVCHLVLLDANIPGVGDWGTIKHRSHVWRFAFHQVADLPEALLTGRERT